NDDLRVSIVAPYIFDASVQQIFAAILNGYSLYIVPEDIRLDGIKLLEFYRKNKIDVTDGTPSHINMLLEGIGDNNLELNIERFVIGGDILPHKVVENFLNKLNSDSVKIINVYGPTECSVDSTIYEISKENIDLLQNIPIGMPMPNAKIYILDKENKLQPIGVAGDIYISGDGVGRGYLKRIELTKEKFVDNPFISGEKMYRAGDIGRWLEDGNIEILGRIDHQVKIRGHRIELEEIENQLLKNYDIKEAVVMAREDKSGDKYLCAYIVGKQRSKISELRNYLSIELPEYMVPTTFIQLDRIPRTPNGKIDREALLKMEVNVIPEEEYEGPRNETEEIMVGIWQEVLLTEQQIGINDNFFNLGGHSLKAMIFKSRLYKEVNIEVPLQEIFKNPTIKGISKYIDNAKKSEYSSIQPIEEKEYYLLSSAQKRMYVLSQLDQAMVSYNMPTVLELNGKLHKKRFEEAFKKLINRHESLRTSFEIVDCELVQKINEEVDFKIQYIQAEEKGIDGLIQNFVRLFDLKKAPLFRVALISLSENKYILMMDSHHIISDGVSTKILVEELVKFYKGEKLPNLKIQYKDYAAWQKNLLSTEALKRQEQYWLDRFKGDIPVLNMPTDYPRPIMKSYKGERIDFKVDKKVTNELYKIARENKASLYMVLLAAYNVLLYKYTGQEDIVVGSPITGRSHADIHNVVGMFVNLLAMRNDIIGTYTFKELITKVKENGIKAYESQDYPFEDLVEKLPMIRDMSRSPLFDTIFEVQNINIEKIEINGIEIKPYKFDYKLSKYDLVLSANESDNIIRMVLNYSTTLFNKATAEKITKHYIEILNQIVKNNNIKIEDIVLNNDILSFIPSVLLNDKGDFRF
uniref:condensation domain-containing protein n=1 Tax=Abyssisolibacter fermentans TaxID=1766203 RepID=UPI000A9F3566